ncbi:hypothetical protein WICMUC_002249 [Wickerhamomyces mucosus]|uniref:Uncharacterized protein n=1 Tax=Wickerhamomyces mucosus TaxID=1378264 RepID=A0A9P8PPL0_9ASCO|nr:hypothetical protein WICMUC_002249 [Wickerhamomyces mucosus]
MTPNEAYKLFAEPSYEVTDGIVMFELFETVELFELLAPLVYGQLVISGPHESIVTVVVEPWLTTTVVMFEAETTVAAVNKATVENCIFNVFNERLKLD